MKKIYALFLFSSVLSLTAQITIQHAHLPDAGDILISRNASFLGEFDPEVTGTNFTWNIDFDLLQPLNLNAGIPCIDVDDTPIAYQFLFNNPFDPEHNSDFAYGVEQADVATISFEDAYQYFKNSGNVYSMTGMGASINGIPLAAQTNDPDIIYDIPLTYNTSGSSNSEMVFDIPTIGYYGLTQSREYVCDGWGTLNIWDLSFEVVRVRSVVNAIDSIYTELIGGGFGFSFPRPESVTYEWISTAYKVPILKIVNTGGFTAQVQTADIYNDPASVSHIQHEHVSLYPNPASDVFNITGIDFPAQLTVFDQQGRLVMQVPQYNGEEVDIAALQNGLYHIVSRSNNKFEFLEFVK